MNYTKEYISGAEFKKQYEELRKSTKPQEPVLKPLRSIKEIQKDEIAKTEKGIKDTEKTLKEVNAQMAKGIQPVLDMLRKNLKDYQDPGHEYFCNIAMGEKYGKKKFVNPTYESKRTEWKPGFRAGKEVTEQARTFAEKWLGELK